MKPLDMLILGGGSAAFAAAEEALKHAAHVAIVEHGPVGGTCLNRGCVPSKFLLHAGALSRGTRGQWLEVRKEKNRIIKEGRRAKSDFIRRHRRHLTYIKGHGVFVSPHAMLVNHKRLLFKKAIIAVGGSPAIPEIPGIAHVPYLTSNTVFNLPQLPRSILIIGTGPLGLELAQMLSDFGVGVTLVSADGRLLPDEEPEIGQAFSKILHKRGIRTILNCQVKNASYRAGKISLTLKEGHKNGSYRHADALLLATGWSANTQGCGLAAAGVMLDAHGYVLVSRRMRTNVSHIWAAGDCVGCGCPNRNVYVAKRQGAVAAGNALRRSIPQIIDYRAVPRVIFTAPEFASVGLTLAQAKHTYRRVIARTIPLANVPRALLQGKKEGIIKLVVDATTQRLLGASLLSPRAGEVIHEAVFALQTRQTVQQLESFFHAYPTYSEALQLCARLF